jgi:Domain of unknown function (DUF4037)
MGILNFSMQRVRGSIKIQNTFINQLTALYTGTLILFNDTKGIRHRNNRPKGDLPSKNDTETMIHNARQVADQLMNKSEVIGITLSGGLSRGYGDELSDIDITIYLDEYAYLAWTRGEGPVPQGDAVLSGKHFDITFTTLGREKAEDWNITKKWDSSYQSILYDPTGVVSDLLDEKDIFSASEKRRITMLAYLDCAYHGDIALRQWCMRGDPISANHALNRGISALSTLLFIANEEYPPYDKWLINHSYSLARKPRKWRSRLESILIVREITIKEAERRRLEFMKLYSEIWAMIVGSRYSKIGLIELEELEKIKFVTEKKPTLEEFSSLYEESSLSHEILFRLTRREKEGDLERIVFDRVKFEQERKRGFPEFLDWNREILKQLMK